MYLGIDLGTSEVKALLLDDAHRIVATSGRPLTLQRPHPLWSEQEPAAWWAATDAALLELAARCPAEMQAVRGIGLSGQMHGAVLLDRHDDVLRPAILWNDGRSGAQCAALERDVPSLHVITGNLAMPGFTAPKLLWVREHEPAVFAQVDAVLLPKDWLRLGLTGERVSETSDASGTLWLDVSARRWSSTLLDACGLDVAQMPRLVEGSEASGELRTELSSRWGLPLGIVVAGGAGDNAASAVGIGAVRAGEGFLSLGTSGVIFLCNDTYQPHPESALHTFCHAIPDTWHQMSVMLSAASALRWSRELFGIDSEAELLDVVGRLDLAERSRAPLFLPYLSGERTPHNDPKVRGAFVGLSAEHGVAHLGYAVLEGVSFGLRDGWHAFGAGRLRTDSLTLVGGGARSAEWAQLLSSVLETPLVRVKGSEISGALGAARLAWLATGGTRDDVCRVLTTRDHFEPEIAATEILLGRYDRFGRLFAAIR